MSRRFFASAGVPVVLVALLSLAPAPLAAQGPSSAAKPTTSGTKAWNPPRTPDGRPDLQGVWNFGTVTPLERPADLAGKQALTDEEVAKVEAAAAESRVDRAPRKGDTGTYNQLWFDRGTKVVGRQSSLIVDPPDGKLPPYTPEGEKRQAAIPVARKRNFRPEDRNLGERCIVGFNAGPPMLSSAYNNLVQLFQVPGYVVILNEMVHSARVIPVGDVPHSTVPQWSGDSRARWEGDTLVIDTINFRDEGIGELNVKLQGTDKNLHLVERFTRTADDTLRYEFTVDDPTIWTKPWTVSMPMAKTSELIYEYACHEGNYAMQNILSGTRADEKVVAEGAKKGSN